jgi:hypothetical protein
MRERVERDTYMAKSAARRCINFLKAGLPFTLEHPGNSIARELKEWQELVALDGVFIIEHHHCMFSPCLKRKFQIVITNIPSLADPLSSNSLNRTCSDRKVCSRTKCPHEAFTHEIKDGWVSKFGTAGTAEYPEELCEVQAKGIVEAIVERALFNFKFSFVEVFSGPNAPLTEAVKKYINVLNNSGPGLDLALKRSGPSSSKGPVPLQPPKWSSLESRATGLQPKWNSNFQLIKDGLNDPWEHLARAKSLAHPSMDDTCIHSDIQDNMEHAASVQMGVIHERVQAVWWLRGQVKALAEATAQARASAGKAFIAMKSPINPPIIDLLSETFQVKDGFLGSKSCSGLPVVGVADISPFFEPIEGKLLFQLRIFCRVPPPGEKP